MNNAAAIEKAQQKPATVVQTVQSMQAEIARALPKGMDADRVARLALTVIRKSDLEKSKGNAKSSLSECTTGSFAGALLTAAALGLEPGTNGEAYLVPYEDRKAGITECQLIIGYQGMVKLFWQHPLAAHIDAQAVHANDHFDYAYGTSPRLDHRPALTDRGDVIAYYAVASLTTGARVFTVLTPDEVKALRRGKVGSSGNIPDPQHWMERKTVLRQLVKMLPKSAQMQHAVTADEQPGSDLAAQQVPTQIMQAEPPAIEATAAENVNPETGEMLDEQADGWPEVAQTGQQS